MQNIELASTARAAGYELPGRLKRMLKSVESSLPPNTAFEVDLSGERFCIGDGRVAFRVSIHNRRGVSALSSLDEKRIGEAYLDGDITIDGDLIAAFDLRTRLTDRHLLFYLWSTYGRRGVRVTSLTISAESERYVNDLIIREQLPCQVVREHFLEYQSKERYDAIVNLGVTEHLPDYAATLAQYERLLKPGGRSFLTRVLLGSSTRSRPSCFRIFGLETQRR